MLWALVLVVWTGSQMSFELIDTFDTVQQCMKAREQYTKRLVPARGDQLWCDKSKRRD
jgi:hypothetical protein